jgi:hypothetical protein
MVNGRISSIDLEVEAPYLFAWTEGSHARIWYTTSLSPSTSNNRTLHTHWISVCKYLGAEQTSSSKEVPSVRMTKPYR